jgi:hypothetical protein
MMMKAEERRSHLPENRAAKRRIENDLASDGFFDRIRLLIHHTPLEELRPDRRIGSGQLALGNRVVWLTPSSYVQARSTLP